MKLLSIQIPTVVGHEKSFNDLYAFINYQITKHRLHDAGRKLCAKTINKCQ